MNNRKEWFENQTLEIQEKFKTNCDVLNLCNDFFEYWISNKHIYGANNIQGAFVWSKSPEGEVFWRELDDKLGLS